MERWARPRIIGLTGGIACGKSTVAAMLRGKGVPVVDADAVAREVVEPGQPAHDEIVEAFGRDVLDDSGHVDRKRLGALVFGDSRARARLNAITHPRIAGRSRERMDEFAAAGASVIVYEAALLVENGVHNALDGLIVVAAKPETQIARLERRDGITRAEAEARRKAQLPLEDKVAVAEEVIWNDGDRPSLEAAVDAAWERIARRGPNDAA